MVKAQVAREAPVIGYASREVFSPDAAWVFRYARSLVSRVSSHLDAGGREIRCHELARAVACCLRVQGVDLQVVDGALWSIEHTWIVLPGTLDGSLLDVYAPGRLPQVQLLHEHRNVSRGYASGVERSDVRHAVVDDLVRQMILQRTRRGADADPQDC